MEGKALPRANKRPGCANPSRRVSPGRYLGPIWPLFTCPLESTLQTSSSHGPDKAKEPRSILHRPCREDPSLTVDPELGVPRGWRSPGSAAGSGVDPKGVLRDSSSGSLSPGPNPANASLAPSSPMRCKPVSREQGCSWVPFQVGLGRSRHPRPCLSFPLCQAPSLTHSAGFCGVQGPAAAQGGDRPGDVPGHYAAWVGQDPACCFHRRQLQRQLGLLSPSVQTGATGSQGTKRSPTHSRPIQHLALRSYTHPTGQGHQRVSGHERSPTVRPLGPTSPFLGTAKEMKDPRFSPLPVFQRGVSSTALATQAAGWRGVRLRPDTLHHTLQRHAAPLSLFLRAPRVCSTQGCVSTSMEGGKLRQGKQVPAEPWKPGKKDGGRAGSEPGPGPTLAGACCESSRLSEHQRHARSERLPGKEGSVGSPSPAAALFQQTARA